MGTDPASDPEPDDQLDRLVRGAVPGEFSFFGRRKEQPPLPLSLTGIEPGRVIDDFRLIAPIGQGGMGQVWEAQQISLGRRVALKLVRPDRVNEHTLDLFSREARAGGRLSHSGIVSLFGHGEAEGVAWISMELVEEAWTLKDFIDETARTDKLPDGYYKAVAKLLAEVADALQAAHAANVIHRDLKPANVLITPDEHPKVTDFGLAKITDETALSVTGDFAGTYAYMSPEQVAAKRAGLDHRTDVFSLGVVLYEMLTLRRPFDGDTSAQVAQQILMKDPPDPVSVRSRIPRDLAVICGKCLEKDVDRRYQTMAELAADIRRHLGHEPIHARPPTVSQRVTKWIKRNPTKSGVGTVAALALVAIAGLWLRAEDNLDRALEAERATALERDRALVAEKATALERDRVVAAEKATGLERDRALQAAYSGNLHAAHAALRSGRRREARRRLDACPAGLREWEWFHLDLSLDQSLQTLEGHADWVSSVAWNPQGTRIVSGSYDQTLRIWDAATGTSLQTLEGHAEGVTSVAWNPQGTRIVSGSWDKTLRIWDAATGTSLQTLEGHTWVASSVAWDPQGTRIVSGSDDGTLRIWDAATGTSLQTLEGDTLGEFSVAWNPE
ncbi:MAG: serine/threonine-protein kinase, partial [Planctomycetota bacterium]